LKGIDFLKCKKDNPGLSFQYFSKVKFDNVSDNSRSQVAISRVGAKKGAEEEVAYFGEKTKSNSVCQMDKKDWKTQKP